MKRKTNLSILNDINQIQFSVGRAWSLPNTLSRYAETLLGDVR